MRVPRRLAAGGAAVAGTLLGRRGPTMTSADTIKGWNLLLWLTSRMLWSELNLVPRYRDVLQGIPACLDGSVAFGATQCSTVRDQAVHRVVDVPMAHWAWRRRSDSRMDGIP